MSVFRFSIVLAALVLLPAPSLSQTVTEDFENEAQVTSRLGDILLLGEQEPWQGRVAEGAYVLSNEKPGAVKYFYFQLEQNGARTVSVDISADSADKAGGAGILYGFSPEAKTYLAFTFNEDRYTIWKRGPQGLRPAMSGTNEAFGQPGPKRLTVRHTDQGAEFLVDGVRAGGLSSSDITGTDVGLIAIGKGEFRFDNLSIGVNSP